MAEFVSVMKDWRRMCQATDSCTLCPLDGCWCPPFDDAAIFADIENKVSAWAARNPEPVYPTWGEYLCNIGLIHDCKDGAEVAMRLFDNHIPADIAKKLGIEPKEG